MIRIADDSAIEEAAAILARGGLVAFPTETVYGLGADATDERAVARVFEAKGRPRFNPLIVHLADPAAAGRIARLDRRAQAVAELFWPGPLTLVLDRAPGCPVSLLASAGLDTVALRVPDHPVAHRLIAAAGVPIVAPSANRSAAVSPTTAEHVEDSLGGQVDMILDGGPCRVGIESTVLDVSGDQPVLLRPGAVTAEALEDLLGPVGRPDGGMAADAARPSPGMLGRHYAPDRPVRLHATGIHPGEALLAFGPNPPAGAVAMLNLSPAGDLREAAANLFRMLRALDRGPHRAIAVMPVPETGLGLAINDRLRRAATPA